MDRSRGVAVKGEGWSGEQGFWGFGLGCHRIASLTRVLLRSAFSSAISSSRSNK